MNYTPTVSRLPEKQAGFTLIEAMVAIVIMAMGLIGLALMQAQGLKFSDSAYSRTQASMLAYDIIDRMRSHMDESYQVFEREWKKSQDENEVAQNIDDYIGSFVAASGAIDADSGLCSYGQDIAREDLVIHNVACWKDAVKQQLNGEASIALQAGSDTVVEVEIEWLDRRSRQNPAAGGNNDPIERRVVILSEFGRKIW